MPIVIDLLLVAFAIFLFSQVVLPIFINKPFFWIFKKTEKDLLKTKDELMAKQTELKITELKKEEKSVVDKIKKNESELKD